MSNAERRLYITELLGLVTLGFALLLANSYLRIKRQMEADEVVGDVELFLKASRLQELILPLEQEIIDGITKSWIGASYRGILRNGIPGDFNGVSLAEWIRQNSTDISSR